MTPRLIPHRGDPALLGATATAEGVNFAVYSETASAIWVCVFNEMGHETGRFELDGHDDNIHHGLIGGLGAGAKYGLRADGPYDPDQGLHFDPHKLLVDPYAKRLDRAYVRSPRLRLPREDAVDTAELVPLIPPGMSIVPGVATPMAEMSLSVNLEFSTDLRIVSHIWFRPCSWPL